MRASLWSLPEPQHHAFVLRHWSGLSQDEIADVLATTPGAVESLLVRARATLVAERGGGRLRVGRVAAGSPMRAPHPPAHEAHLAGCRRCRTAQSRLLRVSEFATAFALVPRPWVEHTLSSAIPGFGSSAAVTATATTATGGGAGVTAASAATKTALLAKVTLATATAVVALGATHPVRSALADAIAGRPAAPRTHRLAITHAPAPTTARPLQRATEGAQAASVSGKASGKSATAGSNGGGSGGTHGKSATAGSNGKGGGSGRAHGKSATAGSNGNGGGSSGTHGKSATAGGNGNGGGKGTANGKSATAGGNGKASGKGVSAGDNGNASRNGKGKPTS